MKISRPKIESVGKQTRITFDIEIRNQVQQLYFQSAYSIDKLVSDRCDAALVGLMLPAMYFNDDIIIDGLVSDRLLHSVNNAIQDLININNPTLYNRIQVTRSSDSFNGNEVSEQIRSLNSIAGFSGGIDS